MGNNSGISSAFFCDIWSNKTSQTLCLVVIFSILCLLFSQYCLKSKSPLPFEKSIPGLPRLEPHRKVNATTLYKFSQTFKTLRKTANLFSNLDFLPKSEFPKTLDLSMDFQRISHPMDFPPHPMCHGQAGGNTASVLSGNTKFLVITAKALLSSTLAITQCLFAPRGWGREEPWGSHRGRGHLPLQQLQQLGWGHLPLQQLQQLQKLQQLQLARKAILKGERNEMCQFSQTPPSPPQLI